MEHNSISGFSKRFSLKWAVTAKLPETPLKLLEKANPKTVVKHP